MKFESLRLGEITEGAIKGVQRRAENKSRAVGHSDFKRWGKEDPAKGKSSHVGAWETQSVILEDR